MKIYFHKNFKKIYKKFSAPIQKKINERITLFSNDSYDPLLHNHALSGEYLGYRSINITADIRTVYEQVSPNDVFFVYLGTHSELY